MCRKAQAWNEAVAGLGVVSAVPRFPPTTSASATMPPARATARGNALGSTSRCKRPRNDRLDARGGLLVGRAASSCSPARSRRRVVRSGCSSRSPGFPTPQLLPNRARSSTIRQDRNSRRRWSRWRSRRNRQRRWPRQARQSSSCHPTLLGRRQRAREIPCSSSRCSRSSSGSPVLPLSWRSSSGSADARLGHRRASATPGCRTASRVPSGRRAHAYCFRRGRPVSGPKPLHASCPLRGSSSPGALAGVGVGERHHVFEPIEGVLVVSIVRQKVPERFP